MRDDETDNNPLYNYIRLFLAGTPRRSLQSKYRADRSEATDLVAPITVPMNEHGHCSRETRSISPVAMNEEKVHLV